MEIDFEVLRSNLKQALKDRGATYRQLARAMNVSEITVKRLLAGDDVSLSRLQQICAFLNLSVSEVLRAAESGESTEIYQFTLEEDAYFFQHERAYATLILLSHYESVAALERALKLSRTSLYAELRQLEKMGFIEVHEGDRVRFLRKGTFRAHPDGELVKNQSARTLQKFFAADFRGPRELKNMLVMELTESAGFDAEAILRKTMKDLIALHNACETSRSPKTSMGAIFALRPYTYDYLDHLRQVLREKRK